jgi:hypothetical protein
MPVNLLDPVTINTLELPPNTSTWPGMTISSTIWSASPAGLTPSPPNYNDGVDGALQGWTDFSILARTACATGRPAIGSVVPNTGGIAGGTSVVIYGAGFVGATGATFGATSGVSFSVVNDHTIHVTTPAHAVGAVHVVVLAPAGNATTTNGFTYQ